jgi:hypothetical protein
MALVFLIWSLSLTLIAEVRWMDKGASGGRAERKRAVPVSVPMMTELPIWFGVCGGVDV